MVTSGSPSPRRVFLSHTAELRAHPEGRTYVAAAGSAVTRSGDVATDMDYFAARDRAPAEVCRDAVQNADVFVLVAGFRYGSPVEDEPYRSYCELEFEEAGERGLERHVFLLDRRAEGPPEMFADPEGRERQEAFRARLGQRDGWSLRTVRSPSELDAALGRALAGERDDPTGPGTYPSTVGQPPAPPSPRRRTGLVLSALLVVLLLLVVAGALWFRPFSGDEAAQACAPAEVAPAPARPDGVLRIGSAFPQSGDLASQGAQLLAATEMAVEDVNDAGAVPGVGPVLYRAEDRQDEGNPGSGQVCRAVDTLLAAGVDAVMGPAASADALAVADRIARAGRVIVSPASTDPALSVAPDGGRTFRTVPSDLLQGRVLGDLVVGRGARNVAVLARADAYGTGLQREVVEEVSGFGPTARSYLYDPAAVDPESLRPLVQQIAQQKPDAVVLIGYDEAAAVFRALGEQGLRPGTTQMYGAEGYLRKTFATLVDPGNPAAVTGLQGTVPLLNAQFDARLVREHPEVQDVTFAAQAYDAVVVTALAAASARSDDPNVFVREVNNVTRAGTRCTTYAACLDLLRRNPGANIDYDGVSGPLDFTGSGEPCQGQYSIVRFGDGGTFSEQARAVGTYLCTAPLPLP